MEKRKKRTVPRDPNTTSAGNSRAEGGTRKVSSRKPAGIDVNYASVSLLHLCMSGHGSPETIVAQSDT